MHRPTERQTANQNFRFMKTRKFYWPPQVLEISEPKGDSPESIAARLDFRYRAKLRELSMQREGVINARIKAMWEDPEFWRAHGLEKPTETLEVFTVKVRKSLAEMFSSYSVL